MELNPTMSWLTDLLPALKIGPPKTHDNLTLFPIFGPESHLELDTLDQALAKNSVEITEVSEFGHVPTLQVLNHGKVALLLFDGEELVGAKQNRILNTTILVAAGSSIQIPVSCVEQGRWEWRSKRFSTEGRMMKQGMRSAKAARMTTLLSSQPDVYDAGQGSVWEEISQHAQRRGATSETGAMAAVFERDRPAIESFVEALRPEPGQTGVAAFVNGKLVGIDLLGSATAFSSIHHKLVRSLAAEAIDCEQQPASCDAAEAMRLLEALPGTRSFEATPPGLGRDLRFTSDELNAAGLVADAGLVHLAVFQA